MGSEKTIFLSILVIALTLVIASRAADPECEIYPPGVVVAFPHEYNCSLYYECFNGDKILLSCPDGKYFNTQTESCDFPSVSGCKNGDAQCADVDVDYLPIPGICTEYIECYFGDSYLMTCPEGYWFDSVEKKCVEPGESDCQVPTTPPWTTPSAICYGVRPNEVHLERYDGDCRLYWKCAGAHLTLESCPAGLLFSDERKMCDFPNTVDCDGITGTPNPSTQPTPPPLTTPSHSDPRCTDDGTISYWSHPADCQKYIECYGGVSFEMDCPVGLYFSDIYKSCVTPSLSECGRTEPPTRGPTSERPTDWTPDPDCRYDGWLLPYPGDCTKYYECAEGRKVELPCPPDLWFHYNIQECDYPYLSDCRWWGGFSDDNE